MKSNPRTLPALGVAIFAAGLWAPLQIGGSPAPPQTQAYLAELHLHGSLSEGRASMWNHSLAPSVAGVDYDVLWWTDHTGRNTARSFPFEIDFRNEDYSGSSPLGVAEFQNTDTDTTELKVKGGSDFYGRVTHINPGTSDWTGGGVSLEDSGNNYRISLFADPEIRLDLRMLSGIGGDNVNLVVRLILSSRPGQVGNEKGAPNILEYSNFGLELPTLVTHQYHNTVQIPKFEARGAGFTTVILRPLADSIAHFYEGADQTIHDIEILATSRNGNRLRFDIDNFEFSVDPALSDLNSYIAAERLLHSGQAPYSNLTQHVGLEVAGPRYQKIQAVSSRDHLVALYRNTIENTLTDLYDFETPEWEIGWPRNGVDQIRRDNGISILAHIFSPKIPPKVLEEDKIRYLSERVVENQAWGADAIEVGYELRGAPLQSYIEVWDKLSGQGVYITGVGASDHHNLRRWDLRTNKMGTWIRSTSDSPRHLANAIQSGHTFFGDPFRFDTVDGDLNLMVSGTSTRMGEVHQLAGPEQVRMKAIVVGAQPGDSIVWLHNGSPVVRHLLSSSARTAYIQSMVKPGDWIRIELHTEENEVYMLSNPVYFAGFGDPVPVHRTPSK
jgi:hypothetical protein